MDQQIAEQSANQTSQDSNEAINPDSFLNMVAPLDLEDGSQPESKDAQTDEHPEDNQDSEKSTEETKDSDEKVPTDDAGEEDEKAKDKKEDDADSEKTDDDSDKTDESVLNDLLGIKEDPDAENVTVMKQRMSDKDRTINELRQFNAEYKDGMESLLKSIGREVINTNDGLALAKSQDAKDFNPEDIKIDIDSLYNDEAKDILANGTDEDIRKFFKNTVQGVTAKISEQFSSNVVPATATPEDKRITKADENRVMEEFEAEKLGDGVTARYPDLDDPVVMDTMEKAWKSPAMAPLVEAAAKDPSLYRTALAHSWLLAYRALSKSRAVKASVEQQKQKQTKENKAKANVSGTNAGVGVKGLDGKGAKSKSDQFLDMAVAGLNG